MKIVLANGVFDVLHVGHVWHLRWARMLGDRLVVALTADAFVNKGPDRPVHRWHHRAEMLKELRCVSEVVRSVTAVDAILRVRPDIFVKGIDYSAPELLAEERAACREVGAELRITPTTKLSSSEIIGRIRR